MLDTNPRLGTRMPTTANTNGWDTVFGIKFDDVNQAIINAGSTPDGFDYPMDPQGEAIEGTYSDWQVTGGSGQLLHMTLPVPELTTHLRGRNAHRAAPGLDHHRGALDQLRPAGACSPSRTRRAGGIPPARQQRPG
jgi:hypothetical protein